VVCLRDLEGSGEKKSRRLKPLHDGSGFFFGRASAWLPYKLTAATVPAVVVIKSLLFIVGLVSVDNNNRKIYSLKPAVRPEHRT